MSEINCTDFDDYQAKALLTLGARSVTEDILHAILGMVGEAGEYVDGMADGGASCVGEIGDCLWYASVCAHRIGVPFNSMILGIPSNPWQEGGHLAALAALLSASRMADSIKKTWFYGSNIKVGELVSNLRDYLEALVALARYHEVSLLECATININKLAARYPDRAFNATHATKRDYAVESRAAGVTIK